MKTRFLIAFLFIAIVLTYCAKAATVVVKISQFPNTTSPANSDLFLLASGATNKNISWNQLKDAIGTNPATVTILNNLYVSNLFTTNLYTSNLYTTNLTVVNEFNGKTVITTNLYSSNAYFTNIYLTQISTNYYLFSTNIYQSYPTYVNNEYVSNYFQTNVFNDIYMSNYFNTNVYNYLTNIYNFSTNLTVTNFYLTDNYVSNFFNTNIFNVDNSVSNFFATNIYNTFNYQTDILYQVSQNLTNPVFYGDAFIAPYEDHPNTYLQLISANGYNITLDGWTGDVNASGFLGDSFYPIEWTWDGPTNVLDTWTSDQFYIASTDCKITGIDSVHAIGYSYGGLLTITNASSTNITLRFPSSIIIPERTNAVVISNASQGMLSIKLSRQSGTNGVYRQF